MRRPISRMALLIVALLSFFWVIIGLPILIGAYDYDFLCFYIGGTLAREGRFADLYRPAAQLEVQEKAAPGLKEFRPYPRPPWFALAIAPLTALTLVRAYAVWIGLLLLMSIACWIWAARRFGEGALLLAALFLPTNLGICYGQDCVLMLVVLCGAYALLAREKTFTSGLVLGLGLMKFHLMLLFPVWLAMQRRWRMLAGFAIVGAIFLGAALGTLGFGGVADYVKFLRSGNIELLGRAPDAMINIYSVPVNGGIDSRAVDAVLAGIVIILALFGMRGAPAWRALAIAATGSLLITPHVFAYDAAMLLLAVWLAIENSTSKFSRWAALAVANPVTFFFTAAHPPWRCVPAIVLVVFLVALVADSSNADQPASCAVPA